MRWLVLWSVLWPCIAFACPSPDCVRIGSWNIEWLGSDKRTQPVDKATIEQMAHLIAVEWSIDLITLQEINTELQGEHRGSHYSTAPWLALKASLEKRGYRVAEGHSGYAQHIVMAWREPVRANQPPKDLPVNDAFQIHEFCRSSNLRKPLTGQFQAGQFDFWLIGLHLKANTGQSACATAIRLVQSRELASAIETLRKRDRDVVLAGDFNASPQHDSLIPLRNAGLDPVTGKAHRHQGSQRISHIGNQKRKPGSGTLLDHLFLHPHHTSEWLAASTYIYNPRNLGEFESQFSDHLPIWADFSTKRDDD